MLRYMHCVIYWWNFSLWYAISSWYKHDKILNTIIIVSQLPYIYFSDKLIKWQSRSNEGVFMQVFISCVLMFMYAYVHSNCLLGSLYLWYVSLALPAKVSARTDQDSRTFVTWPMCKWNMCPHVCIEMTTLHVDFDMSEEEWTDVFLRPVICLREMKLQPFQYKIINRIINCNKKLFDMKIEHSPVCSYCDQTDDIGHLVISTFLQNVKTVIFGSQCITETVAVLNFRIFHIKYYIYIQRLFQDNMFHFHEIQNAILAKLEIEKKNLSKSK